jgi:hypothetical protein
MRLTVLSYKELDMFAEVVKLVEALFMWFFVLFVLYTVAVYLKSK